MRSTDQNTPNMINYSLGEFSKRLIIHHHDDLFVAHEHLFQNDTPTRFYHHNTNTFLFLIKGDIYLQQITPEKGEEETALKQHQGIWLAAHSVNTITLLTPAVEFCLIRLNATDHIDKSELFKKVSSGTVESTVGRRQIKTWPLWQGPSGQVILELYPPQFKETLYYQKQSSQYFLPLSGTALVYNEKKSLQPFPPYGKVFKKKEPRAIFNPSSESTTVLSVTTAQPDSGRVLLLSKKT
ncbi:hypothetical protein C0J08_13490 [Marinomonas sp. CT5]|uniref:hypothetical protein n=1 Tax=Marinomonas sp. CT5 TaxID=2066133 RepID=UPI001839A959|nr:hypothetical protein [Marinomonas sp. CT5]NVK75751.1 hypothetical protein [Oceanospirillaceae bacterium]QUX96346.1 hypothetical protein C0J08_13490 [Marinomonas sp. CT5]